MLCFKKTKQPRPKRTTIAQSRNQPPAPLLSKWRPPKTQRNKAKCAPSPGARRPGPRSRCRTTVRCTSRRSGRRTCPGRCARRTRSCLPVYCQGKGSHKASCHRRQGVGGAGAAPARPHQCPPHAAPLPPIVRVVILMAHRRSWNHRATRWCRGRPSACLPPARLIVQRESVATEREQSSRSDHAGLRVREQSTRSRSTTRSTTAAECRRVLY